LLGANIHEAAETLGCGNINQDIIGTAQGAWFHPGSPAPYPEDPHLMLGHYALNPARLVLSVGTSTNMQSQAHYFDPVDSGLVNRNFRDITPGQVYCFEPRDKFNNELLGFTIILELISPTELNIEKLDRTKCNSGPWQFSSEATEFER